jgi:hypothetical protein
VPLLGIVLHDQSTLYLLCSAHFRVVRQRRTRSRHRDALGGWQFCYKCGIFPVFSEELAPWNGAAVLVHNSVSQPSSPTLPRISGPDCWTLLSQIKKKGHFGHGIFVMGRLVNRRSTWYLISSTAVWLVMIWLTLWLTTQIPVALLV